MVSVHIHQVCPIQVKRCQLETLAVKALQGHDAGEEERAKSRVLSKIQVGEGLQSRQPQPVAQAVPSQIQLNLGIVDEMPWSCGRRRMGGGRAARWSSLRVAIQ